MDGSSEELDHRRRRPEDHWGNIEYQCPVCDTWRMFCPGCGSSTRPLVAAGLDDLRMGCFVMLRCPFCVGEDEAFKDRYFWSEHYGDEYGEVLEEYRQIQEADIESKYPGWKAKHAKETRIAADLPLLESEDSQDMNQ